MSDESWEAQKAAREEARNKQTEALAAIDFDPAIDIDDGGMFSMFGSLFGSVGLQIAGCRKCGALVQVRSSVEDIQPAMVHYRWHKENNK